MGLLSKLFGGDKAAEKAAKDLLNGIFGNSSTQQSSSAPSTAPAEPAHDYTEYSDGPSGFSWGDNMPAEENQYNSGKTYFEFFEGIFREELPAYRFEKTFIEKRTIYTFTDGVSKKLVVELMPESSAARKIRNDCMKQGIPYLRFYIDHDGWWNTRAYVADRLHKAV